MTNVKTAVKFPIDWKYGTKLRSKYLTADLFFIFIVTESKKLYADN